jgi:phytoene dehydrogenase-like protein
VLSCERQDLFDELVAQLMEAEQPANAAESELVMKMAEYTWRSRRALALQDACFEPVDLDEDEEAAGRRGLSINPINLDTAMRYHTLHERAYRRASEELMERRKQRQLAEIGFERKRLAEEAAKRKAEKHKLAQEVIKLKKQLQEIRVAKAFIGTLNQNVPKPAAQEREFAVGGAQKAA